MIAYERDFYSAESLPTNLTLKLSIFWDRTPYQSVHSYRAWYANRPYLLLYDTQFFQAQLTPLRERREKVLPKRRHIFKNRHGVIPKNISMFIISTVRTSNLTLLKCFTSASSKSVFVSDVIIITPRYCTLQTQSDSQPDVTTATYATCSTVRCYLHGLADGRRSDLSLFT